MVFCGQCGQPLPPGSAVCPRCGAVTEPEIDQQSFDALHSDDPTIASPSLLAGYRPPSQPGYPAEVQPPGQQKLVLRAGGSNPDMGAPTANAPTNMMSAPFRQPPSQPGQVSSAGYNQQNGVNYTPPISNPPYNTPGQQVYPTPLPQQPAPRKRGIGGLIAVLIILLLLIGVVGVVMAKQKLLLGGGTANTPVVIASPSSSPTDQARAVITQYYDDINQHRYHAAYNLLGTDFHNSQPYANFADGYSHTKHDTVTINNLTPQADSTIVADITIVAQEQKDDSTITSTYQGNYTLGQENGSWKILKGSLNKVS